MICKLIESANHLCIFLAITKYKDDLEEETLIKAKVGSHTQVKLTSREQANGADPGADDCLSERNLSQKKKRKTEEATPTHERKNGRRGTPCAHPERY